MLPITKEMKVGDVARLWPSTMKIFARYQLDLCCGGVHPLDDVAERHGLNLASLLQELNEAAAEKISIPAR